jgi:hypothetical protein
VRALPPGYLEHEPVPLADRRLLLATWHLANGLPAEAHLEALRTLVPD